MNVALRIHEFSINCLLYASLLYIQEIIRNILAKASKWFNYSLILNESRYKL